MMETGVNILTEFKNCILTREKKTEECISILVVVVIFVNDGRSIIDESHDINEALSRKHRFMYFFFISNED